VTCAHAIARTADGCLLCPPQTVDLRLGRYQDVLASVTCDALICDPPYGSRTHQNQCTEGRDGSARRDLSYANWTPDIVREFVREWAPRCRGWIAVMSCSDLAPVWRAEMEAAGRYAFAPVPCVIRGMTVRLSGDGPSSWAVYLNVSRPRTREAAKWGTLPGAYVVGRGPRGHIGGKPLELMQLIVKDYSREGDLVCDPCAGYATTGVAALATGRRFVGAEVDPTTYEKAKERLNA
jgi:hypothetical protein